MIEQAVLTTRQLAEKAAQAGRPVSRERIRQLCQTGTLKADKPGRDWLIPTWAAQEWLEKWLGQGD
jgi:hypothetical protein